MHPLFRVPHHAELALAVIVSGLVLATDLRGVFGFSSFGVLIYYAIANAAAFTQPAGRRRWRRTLRIIGIFGCTVLVVNLPWLSIVAGMIMFLIGLTGHWVVLERQDRASEP